MLERFIDSDELLCNLFGTGKEFAIALPHPILLSKSGRLWHYNYETIRICKILQLNSKLEAYLKEYGEHVFYLGKYQNKNGAVFKVFGFPTKYSVNDDCDATMIMRSCYDLVKSCDKRGVRVCVLPTLTLTQSYDAWKTCYKPIFELLLDDRFVMIHEVHVREGGE
jgi:hypothetical protein